MKQLALDFTSAPDMPEFCGPWMYLRRPSGEFIRLCQKDSPASFNSLAPASWSGFYCEKA